MKFEDICDRLRLVQDMNGDYQTTITDVMEWGKFVCLIPAKLCMIVFDNIPVLREFFETGCETGVGSGAVVFSAFVWWIGFASVTSGSPKSSE